MKRIFIDTSAWLALVNISDIHYEKATEIYQSKKSQRIQILNSSSNFVRSWKRTFKC